MSGKKSIGVALVGCALAAAETLNPLGAAVIEALNSRGAAAAEVLNPLGAAVAEALNPQAPGQAAATPSDAAQAVPANATPEGDAVAPRPFDGSLGAGLAEVQRLTEAEDVDAALVVVERLLAPDPAARLRAWLERQSGGLTERALAWFDGSLSGPLRALGLDPGTSAERAEVHYARGVALRAAARAPEAREAYALVRGLGGAARLDAVYELGHIALLAGEGWRSQIPELAPPGTQPAVAPQPPASQPGGAAPGAQAPGAQAPGAQAPGAQAPGAQAPGAQAPAEPDPLQEARRAYQNALDAFVERLRLDWRDADTRANVELVRRRLRELDELEQQRKEQQEQQEQKDQQQGDKQDPQQQEQQDQEQKDPQEQDPEQQDPQQQDPQESESEQPEEQPEPEPEEQPEEDQPEEEQAPEEEPQPTPEPEEGQLTKEQLQRLQQLLEQNRELAEETYKALRQRSRGRAARDW